MDDPKRRYALVGAGGRGRFFYEALARQGARQPSDVVFAQKRQFFVVFLERRSGGDEASHARRE